ncbi:uncharacterized protein LOC112090561 [Morus notabilis]|uniref:uncharacterized protein LOC112090561 n=1 Tax=Morus notabilis TaxID=981085 RepID=UPI000CED04DB|nr:uncharacterized protein LOC112090561 [Morus notabilis]
MTRISANSYPRSIWKTHAYTENLRLEVLCVVAYEIRILADNVKGTKCIGALYRLASSLRFTLRLPTCIIRINWKFSTKTSHLQGKVSVIQLLHYSGLFPKISTKKRDF